MKLQTIRVRGGQHHEFQKALDNGALHLGCQLHLVRDPTNEYDSNAIQAYVKTTDQRQEFMIGYVAANQAGRYSWRMDQGAVVHLCTVTKIDKHGLDAQMDLRGGWGNKPSQPPDNQGPADGLEDDIPF